MRAAVPTEPQPRILLQLGDDGAVAEGGKRGRGFSVAKLSPATCSIIQSLDAFQGARCVGAGHG